MTGVQLLEDVLPDLTGTVDLVDLARAAEQADIDAGVLTDEEVHWLSPDPDAEPDGFLDAPRLAKLPPAARQVALETALWMLRARGEIEYDPSTDRLRIDGTLALLGELRNRPEAAVSLRVDERGTGTHRAGIYRVRHELFLTEEVADTGLHRFVFRSPARQACWLASAVDREQRATSTSGPCRTVATLDATGHDLAARSEVVSFAYAGIRTSGGRHAEHVFSAYSGPDGVHVLSRGQPEGEATLQRLSGTDLQAFCGQFLAGSSTMIPWQPPP